MVPYPSGLNASASGALSVIYGTTANTSVQGNDPRVVAALQSANNLSDLANLTSALQNLKLTGATPITISASTTGNAGTATKLAGSPVTCVTGQYAIGITAVGNASCTPVQYSQITGTPAAYSLPAATNTSLGGVMVGPGLTVSSSGTISANIGTTPGTVTAGNDSRFSLMLQAANNLGDIPNVAAALAHLNLTGANPVTISASTSGSAATASALQGSGPLQILGATGSAPIIATGQLGMWFDSVDQNLHLLDPSNNRSTLIRTLADGTSTNCGMSSFVTGFQPNGVPLCGSISAGTGKIGIAPNSATIVGSCGASPTLSGNDSAGIVVAGSGTVTACTVTFSSPFTNSPICTASDNSNFVAIKPSATSTALTLSAQASFGGNTLSYICIGK